MIRRMSILPHVLAVHRSRSHSFSKYPENEIRLLQGLGVEGDAHAGAHVKHRSHQARDASRANLRQVHLLQAELFDTLIGQGFAVFPGDLGENITTRGIDLLSLPEGSLLHIGSCAVVELTGLRNPCGQIDRFQQGLMAAVLDRRRDGSLVRKTGVMGVVSAPGEVRPGDAIEIQLPAGAQRDLAPV
jgi:MOSC domain-containing protein YiiM